MASDQQLEWERRFGKPAAAAAFLSAALTIGALIYENSSIKASKANDYVGALLSVDRHPTVFLVASICLGLATACLVGPLAYLYRATKSRRPQIPRAALILIYVGPLVTAILNVAVQQSRIDDAHRFARSSVGSGGAAQASAKHISSHIGAIGSVGYAAGIAIAFAFILVCTNAMRAGLLSRLMGIIGIIIGVFFAVPLFGPTLLLIFWLPALAALFLARWPNGRGPAWDSGEALPWPSQAERREQLLQERGGGSPHGSAGATQPEGDFASVARPPSGHAAPDTTHPRSKKRKRKRR